MKTTFLQINLAGIITFSLLAACDLRHRSDEEESSQQRMWNKTVRMDNVESVNTDIAMKAGKLTVTGGAQYLMEADIQYSREQWKPDIRFSDNGKTGRLSIEQPSMTADFNLNIDEESNAWTIHLNDRIQQDLHCEIGAGQTELNLQGLNLSRVRIDAGVGEHKIDLRDSSVPEMEINAGVGEVSIDLTGAWRNDLNAEINGGIGQLNLRLPRNVGIRLEVSGGLGSVDAPGLQRQGRVYTNDLYGNASQNLVFDVKAGMGSIEVAIE